VQAQAEAQDQAQSPLSLPKLQAAQAVIQVRTSIGYLLAKLQPSVVAAVSAALAAVTAERSTSKARRRKRRHDQIAGAGPDVLAELSTT
jgi:hypothetical protein